MSASAIHNKSLIDCEPLQVGPMKDGGKLKKKWVKPELLVLVRNKREEGILTGCKNASGAGGVDVMELSCGIAGCELCTFLVPS